MIDNNEFNNLGNIWDDGSNPWDTEDLSDLHRLLDDEGEQPFPDEQTVESRSARREVQEPQARSHRAAKAPKEPPKKAKASKQALPNTGDASANIVAAMGIMAIACFVASAVVSKVRK